MGVVGVAIVVVPLSGRGGGGAVPTLPLIAVVSII